MTYTPRMVACRTERSQQQLQGSVHDFYPTDSIFQSELLLIYTVMNHRAGPAHCASVMQSAVKVLRTRLRHQTRNCDQRDR